MASSNVVYDNFIIENKFEEILSTKVDLSNYMTVDRSLTENAGMVKKIHKYTVSGNVEDLAMTEGNSQDISSTFTEESYTVGVTQGRGNYYDEQAMTDPLVVDNLTRGLAETMVNDFTKKAIAEYSKNSRIIECDFATTTANYFFDKVVDALALFGEDETGLTLLINPAQKAYARKQLGDALKYVEGFVRTGYIGSVSGVPVVVSKAVPDSCAFIVNNEAVTLFIKRDTEVEQQRDPDTRNNKLWIRKVALVALTNEKKIVTLAKAQTTAVAITTYTKDQKTIAGTCGIDVAYVIVVDGDGEEYKVTPSTGAWTVTAKANLTAGDVITATAYAYGYAPKTATVTVAE